MKNYPRLHAAKQKTVIVIFEALREVQDVVNKITRDFELWLNALTTEGDLLTLDVNLDPVRIPSPGANNSIKRNAANTAWEAYTVYDPVTDPFTLALR